MTMKICGTPGCWGVETVNVNTFPWQKVLKEASEAGYSAIELGAYGYIPVDNIPLVTRELEKNNLGIVAGAIFEDLLDDAHLEDVLRQVDDVCTLMTKLPKLPMQDGQRYEAPYMTVMDWGHTERDFNAGHSHIATRLPPKDWDRLVDHYKTVCQRAASYGVRPVIHPHAGSYVEYSDEIDRIMEDIPEEICGLCLDTGHLYYSGMDPAEWIYKYADRLDYVHFKDINKNVYEQILTEHIHFFDGCARGTMCPIGQGVLDYTAIHKALKDISYSGYITIEQECSPDDAIYSLQNVKASIAYLKSIGFHI